MTDCAPRRSPCYVYVLHCSRNSSYRLTSDDADQYINIVHSKSNDDRRRSVQRSIRQMVHSLCHRNVRVDQTNDECEKRSPAHGDGLARIATVSHGSVGPGPSTA
jgi:hypothetical protein